MFDLHFLISHAEKSFENSENNVSKLSDDIISMWGMSGIKTRHLYNNLCSIDNCNYLEVGTHKGSSFVSSVYKNNVNSIAVDNWSEFGGPKYEFLQNVQLHCSENRVAVIEKDCYELEDSDIKPYFDFADIYLFDGCHTTECHRLGITKMVKFLSKFSIIVIDDWGWVDTVQKGTYQGLEESGLIVHKKIEKITNQGQTGPQEYWNGFGLFVCERTDL
jgi:hypothetical protein